MLIKACTCANHDINFLEKISLLESRQSQTLIPAVTNFQDTSFSGHLINLTLNSSVLVLNQAHTFTLLSKHFQQTLFLDIFIFGSRPHQPPTASLLQLKMPDIRPTSTPHLNVLLDVCYILIVTFTIVFISFAQKYFNVITEFCLDAVHNNMTELFHEPMMFDNSHNFDCSLRNTAPSRYDYAIKNSYTQLCFGTQSVDTSRSECKFAICCY